MNKVEKPNIWLAVFYWLLTIGYMGMIFYVSSRNNISLPDISKNIDKVLHTGAYMPLAYLLYKSIKSSGARKHVFLMAFLFAVIYGITDELHQSVVPGRDAAIGDILADTLGAFLGSLAANYTNKVTSAFTRLLQT